MADDYERADDVGEDEEEVEELELFPVCQRCHVGSLLPFSDHERDGAPLRYKAWACSNPGCGFNLKIRRGDIVRDEPIHRG